MAVFSMLFPKFFMSLPIPATVLQDEDETEITIALSSKIGFFMNIFCKIQTYFVKEN